MITLFGFAVSTHAAEPTEIVDQFFTHLANDALEEAVGELFSTNPASFLSGDKMEQAKNNLKNITISGGKLYGTEKLTEKPSAKVW